jgi:hypothetical protein
MLNLCRDCVLCRNGPCYHESTGKGLQGLILVYFA